MYSGRVRLSHVDFLKSARKENRKNLIEAKASDNRENIRMAVGQLLDYAYQGKGKCEKTLYGYSSTRKT
jgi:hypothetical protein